MIAIAKKSTGRDPDVLQLVRPVGTAIALRLMDGSTLEIHIDEARTNKKGVLEIGLALAVSEPYVFKGSVPPPAAFHHFGETPGEYVEENLVRGILNKSEDRKRRRM